VGALGWLGRGGSGGVGAVIGLVVWFGVDDLVGLGWLIGPVAFTSCPHQVVVTATSHPPVYSAAGAAAPLSA